MLLFSVDFRTTLKSSWVIVGEDKVGVRKQNIIVKGVDDFF